MAAEQSIEFDAGLNELDFADRYKAAGVRTFICGKMGTVPAR